MSCRNVSISKPAVAFSAFSLALLAFVSLSISQAGPTPAHFETQAPLSDGLQDVKNLAGQLIDPAKVIGRETCRECHDQEFAAWQASSHGSTAWKLLEHAKAPDFAAALGIPADQITSADSVCTQCHGTPMIAQGQLAVVPGNSCESCHGAAGGRDGWFMQHGDYGKGMDGTLADLLAQRESESADHRDARLASCKSSGMNRADDVLTVAKNCLTCHIVPIEELLAAGHPTSSGFEIVRWSQGEVRHNFLLDRTQNSEAPTLWLSRSSNRSPSGRDKLMFVAGKLADLELSLRIRAQVTATDRGSLGREVADRIDDAAATLVELEIPTLQGLGEVVENYQLERRALRELTANDAARYTEAADQVAQIADEFVAVHADGNDLPDTIRISPRVIGRVFNPAN